jgi:hypothetical protein
LINCFFQNEVLEKEDEGMLSSEDSGEETSEYEEYTGDIIWLSCNERQSIILSLEICFFILGSLSQQT